jgi:hypothetical protein
VLRNWLKALLAVLLGNLVYFRLLMPHLPLAGRHRPNRLDWGLAVDFWVCLCVYGLIDLFARKLRPPRGA